MAARTASATARTAANGVARVALGTDGRWVVAVRHRGFAPQAVDVRGVDLADGWTTRIALSRGFALTGRVLDGGCHGIAGASVVGESASSQWRALDVRAALAARATTDDQGRFALEDLPAGSVQLLAARPDGVATCAAVASVPNVATIDLVLDFDAAVAGVVTDAATGTPIAGAAVDAWARHGSATCGATTTTDAEGSWRIYGLPLPTVLVTASKPGYLSRAPRYCRFRRSNMRKTAA